MRAWLGSFVCIFSLCGVAAADELDVLHALGDTRFHDVTSEIVGRDYHIVVGLPANYDEGGNQDYPTVYLLDGGALYPMLRAYGRYLRLGEEIPDLIFVAISYGTDDYRDGNDRGHDFTAPSDERESWGGAADFQRFLSDELIPMIESAYRSRPDRRIVFGHSLGGQFVLHAALTAPDLFWGHLASNPALHRNLPFFLQWYGDQALTKRPRVYVGSGSDDTERFRIPARQWISHWSSVDDRPFDLETATLPGHTHMSTPPTVFRRGLAWLFTAD